MSGIIPSASPRATDNGHDGSSSDWLNQVDANFAAFLRLAGNYAARAQATPDMTLLVGPGAVLNGATLTEIGAWTYGTVASGSMTIANVGLTGGVAIGMPIIAYAYVGGALTQLFAEFTYVTAITNGLVGASSLTVSSNALASSPVGQNAVIIACQGVGGTFSGNTHATTTLDNLPTGVAANIFPGMLVVGSDIAVGTTVASVASTSVTLSAAATGTHSGNSYTFSVPKPASNPRIDLLSVAQSTGLLAWTEGTEASSPAMPATPAGNVPIAALHLTTSTTALTHQSNISDKRAQGVASGAIANAQLANMAARTIKANNTGSAAAPSDISASAVLDLIGSTQGDVLFRDINANGWNALAPGTSGQVLQTQGAGANPVWAGVSALLDLIGATQGDILYRDTNTNGWKILAPGTAGQYLQTLGAGANPIWASPSGIPQQGITFHISAGPAITVDHAFGGVSISYTAAGVYSVTLGSTQLVLGGFTAGVATTSANRIVHIATGTGGVLTAGSTYTVFTTNTQNTFGATGDPNGEVTLLFY